MDSQWSERPGSNETLGEYQSRKHVEGVPAYFSVPASELVELRNAAIRYFYRRVCRLAEKNMELTGTVSGAHWNAMQQVLKQMRIDVDIALDEEDEGE